ncbi:MAG: LicD family protein [Anaeroplasmataceae bacterium]|nr:LicD family protein [Anaeroplasmataceae bacterium]
MKSIRLNEDQLKKLQDIEIELLQEVDRICQKHNLVYTLAFGTLLGAVRHQGFIPWDDDIDIWMPREDYNKFKEICKTELNEKYFYQSHSTDKKYYYVFDKLRVNNTVFKETFLAKHKMHHGVFLDIFPLDYVADKPSKRKRQYFLFHFYRTGLISKFVDIKARKGKKKFMAMILKLLYLFFPMRFLYKKANKHATKYQHIPQKYYTDFSVGLGRVDDMYLLPVEYFKDIIRVPFGPIEANVPKQYDELLRKTYGDYMQLPPVENRKTEHDLLEFDF